MQYVPEHFEHFGTMFTGSNPSFVFLSQVESLYNEKNLQKKKKKASDNLNHNLLKFI